MAINVELEKLYHQDREERLKYDGKDTQAEKIFIKKERERIERVKELLPSIDTNEIWNCHYLAYFFHHGDTVHDYKTAYKYAKKAVDMGSSVTKWLYAASLDRALVSENKPQKFGTQFKKVKGKWEQLPVDNTITDEERKEYGVAPLDKALEVFLKEHSE